jgi:hypothetical protein
LSAQLIRLDGVYKAVVDIPTQALSTQHSASANGWTFGVFKTIQDVVRLVEVEGLFETNSMGSAGKQKKYIAKIMYEEWESMGCDQAAWDLRFSKRGKVMAKTAILQIINDQRRDD